VGEAFSGTVDYNPTAATFLGGTSSFAQYAQSGNLSVLTGATTYEFPLWEIFVSETGAHLQLQFIATDFNTNLFIRDVLAQNALVLPTATTLAQGGGPFHIWLSDASQATGAVNSLSAAPLPAALPLFATGLGALGLLGWRRKRKATATA
jgi:hypothetical protein